MLEHIYEIVCSQTGLAREKIDPAADLVDDLGVSELAMVRIVQELERRFGITVPDEEISELKTVSDLERYIVLAYSAGRYKNIE